MLLNLIKFNFAGEIRARLELFQHECHRYEQRSGETLSLNLRIGFLLNALEEGPLREHLLLHGDKYDSWLALKEAVADYKSMQTVDDGTVAMHIGVFSRKGDKQGKGGKGKQKNQQDQQPSGKNVAHKNFQTHILGQFIEVRASEEDAVEEMWTEEKTRAAF